MVPDLQTWKNMTQGRVQDSWFKRLNKMQMDELPECVTEALTGCQIRPQGYGGGQGEPVPDSIGDSPISPDTPTRPILGTEEVIEVARGE